MHQILHGSQPLKTLKAKMQEYVDSDVRLGVLINPQEPQVEIYRPGQSVAVVTQPAEIDCSEVLPGFVLKLDRILGRNQ